MLEQNLKLVKGYRPSSDIPHQLCLFSKHYRQLDTCDVYNKQAIFERLWEDLEPFKLPKLTLIHRTLTISLTLYFEQRGPETREYALCRQVLDVGM